MKIGRQLHHTSAISSSNEAKHRRARPRLCARADRPDHLHRSLLAAAHRRAADAAQRACSTRRWSRSPSTAWCRACRRPHDLRRRARRAAGRGRRRHPRLRLGGPRLVGDRGRGCSARSTRARSRRRRSTRRRSRVVRAGAPPAARSPATATRCTRSATRASARCSTVAARGRRRPALHVEIAEAVEALMPAAARQGPEAQRLRRDPRGAARRRLSGAGAEGRADPGAHGGPDRAPARGARRPIGFALSYQATREMEYDGAVPDGFAGE